MVKTTDDPGALKPCRHLDLFIHRNDSQSPSLRPPPPPFLIRKGNCYLTRSLSSSFPSVTFLERERCGHHLTLNGIENESGILLILSPSLFDIVYAIAFVHSFVRFIPFLFFCLSFAFSNLKRMKHA